MYSIWNLLHTVTITHTVTKVSELANTHVLTTAATGQIETYCSSTEKAKISKALSKPCSAVKSWLIEQSIVADATAWRIGTALLNTDINKGSETYTTCVTAGTHTGFWVASAVAVELRPEMPMRSAVRAGMVQQ